MNVLWIVSLIAHFSIMSEKWNILFSTRHTRLRKRTDEKQLNKEKKNNLTRLRICVGG
jgi:hypothetical protein